MATIRLLGGDCPIHESDGVRSARADADFGRLADRKRLVVADESEPVRSRFDDKTSALAVGPPPS